MRTSRIATRSFALGLLPLLSCGNKEPLSASTLLEQECSAYANVFRSRETTCYGVSPEPDEATLISREVKSCVLSSGAPGSMVGANYWNSCASAANNNCGAYKCSTYPAGARQTGEACLVSMQCASLWCKGTVVTADGGSVITQALQCGACSPRLTEGSPCNLATDTCEVGMSCFQGACRKQGQAGASCVSWSDCAFPSVCRSNGVCGGVLGRGQACTSSLDCTTNEACDLTSKVCASVQFGQSGATCDGEVHRCESGYCNKVTETCPAVLSDGSPCDPSDPSAVCEVYSLCFGGTCQIPDPADCG
jgi:hypothetical protein